MEGLLVSPQPQGFSGQSQSANFKAANADVNAKIIESISTEKRDPNAYEKNIEAFSFTVQKVLEKLNAILLDSGVPAIEAQNQSEYTPEKTADRLVSQIGGLFAAYEKQNADKSPEELLSGFMELARKGVEQGYDEAYGILKDIGAFDVPGVQEGTEETKQFIDEKLDAFENFLAKKLGIATEDEVTKEDVAAPVKESLLAQGGVQLNVAA